jgi:pyruvate dehydrogenase E2 component (dihydrolipoamide acetyltransferase)
MAKKMALPKIGVNMTEATITKWLVKPGDTVNNGDAVLEAETDKSIQEIYATESGTVSKLLAEEGDVVQCYQDILLLDADGSTNETAEKPAQLKTTEAPVQKIITPVAPPVKTGERVRVSPLAKKTAKDMQIDIQLVKPARPGARIVNNDVLAFAKRRPAAPAQAQSVGENLEVIPMTQTRKTIAARMSESNLTKPCAALTLSANAEAMLALREQYRNKGIKISIDAILAKIAGHALAKHRIINSVLEGDSILVKRDINVGVAVDTPKGLTVAVIRNADCKLLAEISDNLNEMAVAAKESRLGPDDMTGGTFTITNLGMFGIEQFTPIINPPECCILSVGAIQRMFVPDQEGLPVVQNRFNMTLVFDHRIVDGAPAAKFLQEIKELAEMPSLLI